MTEASPRLRGAVLFFGAFVLFVLLGATPIRSYDYFWHLATGRWIAEHAALPLADPFSVGSDRIEWINGSWLFQWLTYWIYAAGDHVAVNLARVVTVAATFALIAIRLHRVMQPLLALAITVLCFAGAAHRLGTRPETAGLICCLLAVSLLLQKRQSWRMTMLFVGVVVLWANIHPSALLAPVASALVLAATMIHGSSGSTTLPIVRTLLSVAALAVTPHGWKGVVAPLQLASQVGSETFVNLEWLPTSPLVFPLFYLALLASGTALLMSPSRDWKRIVLFAFFGLLAARYVRNHGFFFATLPLLLEPELAMLSRSFGSRKLIAVAAAAALLAGVAVARLPFALGVDPQLFPHQVASTLEQLPLEGTIYNADQFGGFLIWHTYPARRVLTDGRNELHKTYLATFAKARRDNRVWNAFLSKYRVESAVEEYQNRPLQVVDPTTGKSRAASPSLAFFPRRDWALVDFDHAAMLFVRRNALDAATLDRLEYRELRPDLMSRSEVRDPKRFIEEFRRAAAARRAPERLRNLAARLQ